MLALSVSAVLQPRDAEGHMLGHQKAMHTIPQMHTTPHYSSYAPSTSNTTYEFRVQCSIGSTESGTGNESQRMQAIVPSQSAAIPNAAQP